MAQRADLIQTVVRPAGGLFRVPADGGINEIIRLRDGDGALRRHGTVARVNNQCNATLVHGTQHLIPIRVELPAVVVRVRIKILRHSA